MRFCSPGITRDISSRWVKRRMYRRCYSQRPSGRRWRLKYKARHFENVNFEKIFEQWKRLIHLCHSQKRSRPQFDWTCLLNMFRYGIVLTCRSEWDVLAVVVAEVVLRRRIGRRFLSPWYLVVHRGDVDDHARGQCQRWKVNVWSVSLRQARSSSNKMSYRLFQFEWCWIW